MNRLLDNLVQADSLSKMIWYNLNPSYNITVANTLANFQINAYDGKPNTLEALVKKLAGESEFTGVSSVDAYCGLIDTHIWRNHC